jgi:hypothetical protein
MLFYPQMEAAKEFLSILRSYLDSLCQNIRSHTITNVQSNDDKVCIFVSATIFLHLSPTLMFSSILKQGLSSSFLA